MSATAVRDRPAVEAARPGSSDALAVLYRDYGLALHRLAYRLTGTRQDAEDVVPAPPITDGQAVRAEKEGEPMCDRF